MGTRDGQMWLTWELREILGKQRAIREKLEIIEGLMSALAVVPFIAFRCRRA